MLYIFSINFFLSKLRNNHKKGQNSRNSRSKFAENDLLQCYFSAMIILRNQPVVVVPARAVSTFRKFIRKNQSGGAI